MTIRRLTDRRSLTSASAESVVGLEVALVVFSETSWSCRPVLLAGSRTQYTGLNNLAITEIIEYNKG